MLLTGLDDLKQIFLLPNKKRLELDMRKIYLRKETGGNVNKSSGRFQVFDGFINHIHLKIQLCEN